MLGLSMVVTWFLVYVLFTASLVHLRDPSVNERNSPLGTFDWASETLTKLGWVVLGPGVLVAFLGACIPRLVPWTRQLTCRALFRQ